MAREISEPADASLDDPLDDDLAAVLDRRDGDDPATVRDWVDAATDAVAASPLDADDLAVEHLCHADDGDHVATVRPDEDDAETYRFQCFLDGLVLAGLVDEPVAVTTHDPQTGERLTFAGSLDDVATDAAVVSLGVADRTIADDAASVIGQTGQPTQTDLASGDANCGPDCCGGGPDGGDPDAFDYDAVCPYVNAFATRDAYESWRDRVDAATTAIPPATAIEVARELGI